MGTALLVLAVVVGVVVLLLAVPLGMAFDFRGVEGLAGQVRVGWLFGLVRFRVDVPRRAKARPSKRAERKVEKARSKPKAPGRPRDVFAVIRQAAFRARLHRFAQDLVRAAHAHDLYLHLRLGLGDPADTGRLWALLGPLNALVQNLPNAQVRIEPEFVDPVLEFETRGRLLVIPLQIMALSIAFALSPASIRAWRTLRGSRG